MDEDEFKVRAKEAIDMVFDYMITARDYNPLSDVKQGYLREHVPQDPPTDPEKWEDIVKDFDRYIFPGILKICHPHHHAYTPWIQSHPSTIAEIFINALPSIPMEWRYCPAGVELEVIVMDWLAKMLGLPEYFLYSSKGDIKYGGGCLQNTACESTLIALISARKNALQRRRKVEYDVDDWTIMSKFVAYASEETHLSFEKACLIACIRQRKIDTNADGSISVASLNERLEKDKDEGLIPIFVLATLGTSFLCAFDDIHELGQVCTREGIWLHVDAALAGSMFICPEKRSHLKGLKLVDSFVVNLYKWMRVSYPASAFWVKDRRLITDMLGTDSSFLDHADADEMPKFYNMQIPHTRQFNALKVWFVIRCYGQNGLQDEIRKDISFALYFEELLTKDSRFEILNDVCTCIVCFRLKATNEVNKALYKDIFDNKKQIHISKAESRGVFFFRFVSRGSNQTTREDIDFAWNIIQTSAEIAFKRTTC